MTYSAQHINPELPITPFYGDLFLKDFSGRFGIKGSYYSLSRELVRMGVCSIDRDMWVAMNTIETRNIDINKETRAFMKKLSKDEFYAIRRVEMAGKGEK